LQNVVLQQLEQDDMASDIRGDQPVAPVREPLKGSHSPKLPSGIVAQQPLLIWFLRKPGFLVMAELVPAIDVCPN
jgi:hypothetical protein